MTHGPVCHLPLERGGGREGAFNMKSYIKPETIVVEIQHSGCLLQAVSSVQSNIFDPSEVSGAAIDARTRELNTWGEDW